MQYVSVVKVSKSNITSSVSERWFTNSNYMNTFETNKLKLHDLFATIVFIYCIIDFPSSEKIGVLFLDVIILLASCTSKSSVFWLKIYQNLNHKTF